MILVAIVLALLMLPAVARAGTAEIVTVSSCGSDVACSKYAGGTPVPVVTYTAAPGENNRVGVLRPAERVVIHDDTATVTARAPCEAIDAHEASCPPGGGSGIAGLSVLLGDGNDSVGILGAVGAATQLSGGDGGDFITGGLDADTIDGGAGSDRLDGGAGRDVALYAGHATAVTVDLSAGSADGPGEHDTLAGFEQVTGSAFADTLIGSAAADVLDGGPGNDALRGGSGDDQLIGDVGSDRLSGGAGDDHLSGDPEQGDGVYTPEITFGNDRLRGGVGNDVLGDPGGVNVFDGGPGNDLLAARNRRREAVRCGPGRDRAYVDRRDRLSGCERRLLKSPPGG